ncbi:Geranylgeranyl transferase type-1 subunit beta [Haplosporangium sp. Z 767]|nr:Geranylgeranyl transferase type-1 subunit beta [Haplosporangium sp. Z 767]KAF9195398.1 Geranylgeranyl transferase type-1 subunit beta [Haplosporangium sp. Z 11]
MLDSQDPSSNITSAEVDNTETVTAATQSDESVPQKKFEREKHINYFKRSLQMLPGQYTSMDTHRMTLGMFALGGLELLGVLEEIVPEANRQAWIEWIYSQQRIPDPLAGEDELSDKNTELYGFGGPFSGLPFQDQSVAKGYQGCECGAHSTVYDTAHITMTYTALLMLILLGDDLSRVAKEPILRSLRKLQQPNGCFIPCITDPESDMRFLYCAAAISHILNDWSGFDRQAALQFIRGSQTYEHGISQSMYQEAHGGPTYCAIATLGLLGGEALGDQKTMVRNEGEAEDTFEERKSRAGFVDKEGTRRWCLLRQLTGFQGRANKAVDTCYSFWIGGALATLGSMDLVNYECNRSFLMDTQHGSFGGFGKWIDAYPDVLHSYMGIAGLSLMGEPGIRPMDPLLNISKRMQERLYTHSVFWRSS